MRTWEKATIAPAAGAVADPASLRAELQEAYRRGRRDERLHHRRSPLVTAGLIAIAAVGAIVLFYAAQQGSFAGGGQVVDAKLSHATGEVLPNAVNDAATQTGSAMQTAGERLKNQGAALDRQASSAPKAN